MFLGSCSAWVAGQWRWDKNVTLGLPSPSMSNFNSWKLLSSVLTAVRTQNSMNDRHFVTQFLVAYNWGEGEFLCLPLSLSLSTIYLRIGGRRKSSDQLNLPSELGRWERAAVVGTLTYAIHPFIPTTIKSSADNGVTYSINCGQTVIELEDGLFIFQWKTIFEISKT